jgi:hypothetical protein
MGIFPKPEGLRLIAPPIGCCINHPTIFSAQCVRCNAEGHLVQTSTEYENGIAIGGTLTVLCDECEAKLPERA